MLFNLRINQKMSFDENISINSVIVFEAMYQLSRLSYATIKVVDGKNYFVLIKSYVIKQLPQFKISARTLSNVLTELERCGLIESIDKNSPQPAYCFTQKSDKYITASAPSDGVELQAKTPKKQPLFDLNKNTVASAMPPEYYALLEQNAKDICNKDGIPVEEFGKFIDHHNSKGNSFKNWLSAFRNWIRNYKKFNPNGGEDKNGMYM